MAGLTASRLLHVWDLGLGEGGTDRALTVLEVACPDRSREELARLPVGRRDALLFEVRAKTVGPRLESLADCPACGAELEFSLDTADVRAGTDDPDPAAAGFELIADGLALVYRLPDSSDLLAAADCPDVASARAVLLRRCVVEARREGEELTAEQLPEPVLTLLTSEMEARDGAAEVDLDLTCPGCGHRWRTGLDIADYFWTEIDAIARRLLHEVDVLARAYGWRETDILGLSATRRQRYLELVGHG